MWPYIVAGVETLLLAGGALALLSPGIRELLRRGRS
jgi:hypothetical protein